MRRLCDTVFHIYAEGGKPHDLHDAESFLRGNSRSAREILHLV
jgi:hypothetical protein